MSVADQWAHFRATAMKSITHPLQIEETRRGFYAGFFASLSSMTDAAREDQTEDEGVIQIEKWFQECEQFFREITAEQYGERPTRH